MKPGQVDSIVSFVLAALGCRRSAPVEYARPGEATPNARIVIVPAGLFQEGMYATAASLPSLPLLSLEGIPLLYGTPGVERVVDEAGRLRLIVHADVVASAFFLLTRYEEIVRRKTRDQHGRFPGKESLPCRAGFLHRPIVDEYAALMRKWLREVGVDVSEPAPRIRKIHLTHDVDAPWAWPTLGAAVKAAWAELFVHPAGCLKPVLSYGGLAAIRDPQDCFQWILDQDSALRNALGAERVESTFFLLAARGGARDGRSYLNDRRMVELCGRFKACGASIGLHASYAAGLSPARLADEKSRLERAIGQPCRSNRHHYLAAREPEDFNALESAGITDDFSMGYADMAGFRLGTSRPVPWYDPVALRLTSLTLHPMTIMECTLDRTTYMGLDYEQAKSMCFALLAEVRKHHGEAVLLWHNTELSEQAAGAGSYQRQLYVDIINHLRERP